MASKIEAAYEEEIAGIEARVAADQRLLTIMKKGLAEYRSAVGAEPGKITIASGAGYSSGTGTAAGAGGFGGNSGGNAAAGGSGGGNGSTAAGGAGGRSRSPERQAILDAAKLFLRTRPVVDRHYPCRTRWILEHLTALGIEVPGTNPINNLSAMLSNAPGFIAHGKRGWTLAENENPDDADSLEEEASPGSIESEPDQLTEPRAQGGEARPGGGT